MKKENKYIDERKVKEHVFLQTTHTHTNTRKNENENNLHYIIMYI